MTGLKHFLKKKEKIDEATPPAVLVERSGNLDVPEFKCIRTTTETEEVIQPPSYPGDDDQDGNMMGSPRKEKKRPHLGFRRSTNNSSHTRNASGDSLASQVTEKGEQQLPVRPKTERKLSERFHLHRDRSRSVSTGSSSHLPDDLPEAPAPTPAPAREGEKVVREEKDVKEHREAQWEKRATILAHSNPSLLEDHQEQRQEKRRSHSPSTTDHAGDETIQEAIRLHELGDLTRSTAMFGRLASPTGANNALAQVLYGLALRHGWGIPPEPENAIHYLALAASNSASVEEAALASGTKKGGAAKGELVLAVFELANCFRHGWGVKKDPVAARQYYETAANLQDTDAMEEAAWCWLEGFGGRKDKYKAAQYLRLAEQNGHKPVGNSWVWKEKYNPK